MPPRPRSDRNRDRRPSAPVDPAAAADDVRRFAELMRSQQARERANAGRARTIAAAERQRADAEAAEARRLDDARAAKERAARRLKDVRARGSNDVVAAAEADYKQALADLLAVEHGERPAWAPALPAPVAPVEDATGEPPTD